MREAVYISNVSRILPNPLGPLNALKTKIYFGAFRRKMIFLFFWGALGAMVPWCQWGHIQVVKHIIKYQLRKHLGQKLASGTLESKLIIYTTHK